MSVYIWCEDSGSGFRFWSEIFRTLYPNSIIETKTNNSRLRKAANTIENDGNEYYILMDSFVDNPNVLREIDRLKQCISGKENAHIVNIRSFEFALLSFQPLAQWVFAEQDDLKEKREILIRARDLFVEQTVYSVDMAKKIQFENLFPYAKNHNNEQVATELLYLITRNTGFETTKGELGDCFVVNCCEWASRKENDICGLDTEKPSANNKKHQLVDQSILKTAFEKAGLTNDNHI